MKSLTREHTTNYVVVTLITLMIWMWASSGTSKTETFRNQISLISPSSSTMIVQQENPGPITLVLRGPGRSITRMRSILDNRKVEAGSMGVPASNGAHQVDLRTVYQNLIDQSGESATVVNVSPKTIDIDVTILTEITLPIIPVIPDDIITDGKTEVIPSEATVRLPESMVQTMSQESINADIDVRELDGIDRGRRRIIKAKLDIPEEFAFASELITIIPAEAEVRIAVLNNSDETVIPSVPVQIALPPIELDRYDVTIAEGDEFLQEVTLRGPSEAIAKIINGEERVVAFIHLTSDNLKKSVTERTISMWQLPPDVKMVRVGNSTAPPTVNITITPIETP